MKQIIFLSFISLLGFSCSIFEDDSDDGSPGGSSLELSIDYPQSVNPGQTITIEFLNPSKESFSFFLTPDNTPSNAQVLDSDGNDISGGLSGTYPEMGEITFSVTEEGTYNFTLSIDNENWESAISISASGCLHLSEQSFLALGTMAKRVLNGVDYCITEEVTIPKDQSYSIEPQVSLQFGTDAGLIVDGSLIIGESCVLQAIDESGWKGFLINSTGSLNLNTVQINEAGHSSFADQPAAAIVNDGSVYLNGSYIYTSASDAYGVYFLDNAVYTSAGSSVTNIDAAQPFYGSLDNFLSLNAHLTGSGFSTIIGAGELTSIAGHTSNIFFGNGAKIHIEGSIQFGQSVNLQSNEITMEANQSLIFSSGMQSSGTSIKGKDGAKWKGVYLNGTNNNFNGMTIKDAGSDFINISGNPLSKKAAVYVAGHLTSFSSCSISGSEGYGLYLSSFVTASTSIAGNNNDFDSNTEAAIAGPLDLVYKILQSGSTAKNTTFTNSTAESVEVFKQTSATAPTGGYRLPDLGSGNYYLLSDNLTFSTSSNDGLTLDAGVHIKVAPAKSIIFGSSNNGGFTVNGTSESPVVIEAEDATAGWNGIHMQSPHSISLFNMHYLNISDGGAAQLLGTTGAANLIFDSSTMEFNMTNCQINDSKGYGIVIESSSNSVDYGDVNNNITFSGNSSGNVLDQNI